MKVQIEVKMDNAAFNDSGKGYELARILRKLADNVQDGYAFNENDDTNLLDINGNKVGTVKFIDD